MSEPVISVEKLSKRYVLGHQRSQGNGLRHVIEDAMRSPLKWLRARREQKREEFWALKDVSFEVRQGDVLGVIGRNGAGKSTLLKILSRITEPTAGRIEIKGRVASLLEVGTGFHPELTGRENIFLNGAILGMSRGEIRRKFDEIVAFSEVEKFLDTPVKRYSSGMYVRLAFAVSAHLEPEILIMDEVLAVGDLQFQKKCLGKLQSVSAKEGRTVLFVSHNLGVVANLCSRGLLLRNGMLAEQGNTNRVISQFINDSAAESGQVFWNGDTPPQSDRVAIRAARIVSEQKISADIAIDQPMYLEVEIEVQRLTANLASSIHLFDKQGAWVLCSGTKAQTLEPGRYIHRYHFPGNFFNDGRYYFNLIVVREATQIEVNLPEALAFFVHETGVGREEYGGAIGGCIRPHLKVESVPIAQ